MRLIHYSVVNKQTNKREYTHHDVTKCEEYLNTLTDKDNYKICYKFVSI